VTAAPIRRPRPDELEALVAIEREAGALFATVGMPEIARDDPGSGAELEPFRAGGRAWVAVAAAEGRPAVTLTTFRDVPWNAPSYERLGFRVVAPADQGPELAALVAEEAERIPGEAVRVAMGRAVR
jgi:hypothetical protein